MILDTLQVYPGATGLPPGNMLHDVKPAEFTGTAKARREFGKPDAEICAPSFNVDMQ